MLKLKPPHNKSHDSTFFSPNLEKGGEILSPMKMIFTQKYKLKRSRVSAVLLLPLLEIFFMGAGSEQQGGTAYPNSTVLLIAGALVLAAVINTVVVAWLSRRDSDRKLKNIRYILEVEENLFQAPTDTSHFHIALKKAEEFLKAKRAFFWVRDGRSSQQRWWSGGKTERLTHGAQSQVIFPALLELLSTQGTIICQDPEAANTPPEIRTLCRELRASSVMMIAVKKRDGSLKGILGVIDLTGRWKNAKPLEQIAVSFSMAIAQYEAYQRINQMGNTDVMTGVSNRNGFQYDIAALDADALETFACVYVDANGLHDINNRLGHAAGDEMLIQIAKAMCTGFPDDEVYRVGGDEFVVLCMDRSESAVETRIGQVQEIMRHTSYEVLSIGMAWRDRDIDPMAVCKAAEQAMREDKKRYYASSARERQIHFLDEKTAQVFSRQRDMETFLAVLAPQFKGVYFVNLEQDSIRHLFIPSYFQHLLAEEDGRFSKGLLLYAEQMIKPEYREDFVRLCDYDDLRERLGEKGTLELTYDKIDGCAMNLQVTRTWSDQPNQETLWIFTERTDLPQDK